MIEKLPTAENGINDLIFRQFLLRGFTEKDGARTWDIADSKLWYLTPEQAKGFLVIERSKEYNKAVTEKEINLLRENVPSVAKEMNNTPTNLIDLGCGDGTKAVLCIEDFMKAVPVRYCPIDISAYMVQEAAHAVESRGLAPVERVFWNISDFENLNNVTPLFRSSAFPHHCFLFLGGTLGNFDHNDILHGIRNGMQEGDVVIIGNGITEGKSPEEWIRAYDTQELDDFCVQVPMQAGLARENLKYDVRFADGRIEMRYVVQRDAGVRNLGKRIEFKAGDVIHVAFSYRYSEDQLTSTLKEFFPSVTLHTDPERTFALAICKL